jgi:hypothetical protein
VENFLKDVMVQMKGMFLKLVKSTTLLTFLGQSSEQAEILRMLMIQLEEKYCIRFKLNLEYPRNLFGSLKCVCMRSSSVDIGL